MSIILNKVERPVITVGTHAKLRKIAYSIESVSAVQEILRKITREQ